MKWGTRGIFTILTVLTVVNLASLQFPWTRSIPFLLMRIQQGLPSVCIHALQATADHGPTPFKHNFVKPAPTSVYLAENTWIGLQFLKNYYWGDSKSTEDFEHPTSPLNTPRAEAEPNHWCNETAVWKMLSLVLSRLLSPFAKMRVSSLNRPYARRRSATGWCALQQFMTLTRASQDSRASTTPSRVWYAAYGPESLALAVRTRYICNSKRRRHSKKGRSAIYSGNVYPPYIHTPAHYSSWYYRFTGLMEEEASPFHNKHHKRGGKDISDRDFEQGDLKASVESVAKG